MRGLKLCSVALTALVSLTACEGSDPGEARDPAAPADSVPEEVASVLDLPGTPYSYAGVTLPAHFNTPLVRDMDNTPSDNPLTDEGATLGRVLFYDAALSANRTVACASCHIQEQAFSDNLKLSEGFDGGLTGRNTMPMIDSRYYRNGRFFWDERADTLEEQVLMPIQNEVEMGLTLDELVERVSAAPYAPYLFEQAFGDEQVTSDRISKALAQFVRAIVSYRSRFDDGVPKGLATVVPPGITHHSEAADAVRKAFGEAGIGPRDVSLVELQDNTVYYELAFPEEWGFCQPGESESLLERGETTPTGTLPINPSGGFLCFGEATTAMGVFQVCELAWQLRGQAGGRQVPGAKVGLAQTLGLGANATAVVLER